MGSIAQEPQDFANTGGSDASRNFTTICMGVGRIHSEGYFYGTNPLHYTLPLLLLQLSLASTIILLTGRLLRPLGQTSMVPQILGGIILGPTFLGRCPNFTDTFFPLRSFIVLDTLSSFGYMFYFFLIGVQTDPWLLKKMEKKTFAMGISTVGLPLIISTACSLVMTRFIGVGPQIASSLPVVAMSDSVISFPIITHFLAELKIINSDFGRVAMSSSIASNLFSFCMVMVSVLLKEHSNEKYEVLTTFCTGIAVALIIAFAVRPGILWMIKHNPHGEEMKEEYIFAVLIGVLVSGFFCQAAGLNVYYGPLVLGMAIPAGPPFGSALVEKLELMNSWLFTPLYFVKNGLVINVFGVKPIHYVAVQFIIFISCIGKFMGSFLPALLCKMPMNDAIALGLVMNAQGILELGMYKMLRKANALDNEAFVVMCTSMVLVTGAITPFVRHLYDPSRRYVVYKKRTVMHSRPDSELRVVVCINDKENVPAIINLLEAFNPTKRSPMEVFILHLIELVGHVKPLLIAHKPTKRPSSKASPSEHVVNAFRQYEENNHSVVSVQPFTAISSYATMHDNVCTIALDKRTSLVILPYHRRFAANPALGTSRRGIRIMNNNVLDKAPCSIAILVDRGLLNTSRSILESWSPFRVAVLFLGGADDWEALAIGTRMVAHPNINLTMVRLLENGNVTTDDMRERKIDNELVSEFRMGMQGNYRVMYIEEVVMDGSGTVAVIRSMENIYELVIVGRRHNKRSGLTLGLRDWTNELSDLGEIGDVLASSDFGGNTTVLVVQQHTNVVSERHEDQIDNLREQNLKLFPTDTVEDEADDVPIQRRST